MEYTYLVLGIVLFTAFMWILKANSKRSGFLHALLRIDTIAGIVAGLYLVISSLLTILGK